MAERTWAPSELVLWVVGFAPIDSLVSGMIALNRSASWWMARIYSFPSKRNGDAGARLSNTSAIILAASTALSAEEVAGMVVL